MMRTARAARPATRRLLPAAAGMLALAVAFGAAAAGPKPAGDPSEFRYEPLPAEGSVDFAIDATSPTFEFQSGPSPFRAFRLPDAEHPYIVDVRSFLEGPAGPARAHVFYPVVALLTDDFLVSRSTELEMLRFDLPVLEQATAPAYRITIGIDQARARERYLVVFTPAQLATRRLLPPISTPESAAEAARVAYLGAAQHGQLRITVRPGDAAPPAGADPR